MKVIFVTCVITALVSSYGDVINVNKLRYLKQRDGVPGCEIHQYYSPPVIYSDWTCREVEESIIYAIKIGCNKC